METLQKIQGIGPELARKLVQRYNVKTVEDLMRPDIYEFLPQVTKIFLQYKPLRSIPRASIEKVDAKLEPLLRDAKFVIAGSYRRGLATSGDIDIVLTDDYSWQQITDIINATQYKLLPPYSIGVDRMSTLMRIGKNYVQVDFFRVNPEEYTFMLLYATGSKMFNIIQRRVAKKKGFLLNSNGLFKLCPDDPSQLCGSVSLHSEEAIFEAIGMKYLPPSKRNK